ncbi:FAD-dependent oxidoreductase [Dactylosporangium sp. CS-033363]|uniref:FAD-dependent oxidoreductase n=1 Tax=Dactylosporangium sp. CS-033363 TaxID=3239935 RepID=UPI003D93BACC
MGRPEFLVLGAGVSGLTTAVYLAERRHAVHVVSDRAPGRTTSAAAGASWGPYLVNDPRALHWSDVTLEVLESIADVPRTGVRMVAGLEVSDDPGGPPEWATRIRDFHRCTDSELDSFRPLYRTGWHYTIPLVDMPVYLEFLADRLRAAGGTTDFRRRVESFDELLGEADCIVNCSGIGARELVPDKTLYPTRGQLLVVENPGIEEFFQDNQHGDDLTYIFPHGDQVVLGGCATDHDDSLLPDAVTADRILERCTKIRPELSNVKVLDHRVGLRPSRDTVRLELVDLAGTPLIHNYGHGSVGVSLSWGCAEAVGDLIV